RVHFSLAPAPGRGLPGGWSHPGGPVAPRPPARGRAQGCIGSPLPGSGPRPEGPARPRRRRLGTGLESRAGCSGAAPAPPLWGRGAGCADRGQGEPALGYRARLIDAAPGDALAHINRGQIRVRLSCWQAAAEDYGKALEVDPDAPQLWLARGRLYARLEKWDRV